MFYSVRRRHAHEEEAEAGGAGVQLHDQVQEHGGSRRERRRQAEAGGETGKCGGQVHLHTAGLQVREQALQVHQVHQARQQDQQGW